MNAPLAAPQSPTLMAYGDRAVLVEFVSDRDCRVAQIGLASAQLAGLVECVPAWTTILLSFAHPDQLKAAWSRIASLVSQSPGRSGDPAADQPTITLQVRYDGPDLVAVATATGFSVEEVVARHLSAEYVVAFVGFSPGFAYLTGLDPALRVARRPSPRTTLPAGSVAIADQFCGVYPRASPGGWQLLGTTNAELWDLNLTPPALLRPLSSVRFVRVS